MGREREKVSDVERSCLLRSVVFSPKQMSQSKLGIEQMLIDSYPMFSFLKTCVTQEFNWKGGYTPLMFFNSQFKNSNDVLCLINYVTIFKIECDAIIALLICHACVYTMPLNFRIIFLKKKVLKFITIFRYNSSDAHEAT